MDTQSTATETGYITFVLEKTIRKCTTLCLIYKQTHKKTQVKYWNDTLFNDQELLEKYLSFGYELPTYSKPIMWGSVFDYTMSQYSHNFTKSVDIYNHSLPGLDWIFIPLGSEGLLTEFVVDLYENKQPFIANVCNMFLHIFYMYVPLKNNKNKNKNKYRFTVRILIFQRHLN